MVVPYSGELVVWLWSTNICSVLIRHVPSINAKYWRLLPYGLQHCHGILCSTTATEVLPTSANIHTGMLSCIVLCLHTHIVIWCNWGLVSNLSLSLSLSFIALACSTVCHGCQYPSRWRFSTTQTGTHWIQASFTTHGKPNHDQFTSSNSRQVLPIAGVLWRTLRSPDVVYTAVCYICAHVLRRLCNPDPSLSLCQGLDPVDTQCSVRMVSCYWRTDIHTVYNDDALNGSHFVLA